MFITDAKERILRVNLAFTNTTGYSEDEIIGQTPALFKSSCHDEAYYLDMYHALQETHYWSGEIWNRHKNGEFTLYYQAISVGQ